MLNPLIVTPCYGGLLSMNYVTSVLRLRTALWQLGVDHEFYLHSGESLVTRARNDCVAYFMAGEWSHLFWIDADIGFEPKDAFRLLQSGKDVVAGVYPKKSDAPSFPIDLDAVGMADERGLAEANEAPTGFMCIARSVFEQMAAHGIGRNHFFDTMHVGDEYLSEDYAFCRRWRDMGGKVFIDVQANLTHQGNKLFTGNILSALEAA